MLRNFCGTLFRKEFMMYTTNLHGLGAAIAGAVKNSSNTRILQSALKAAGFNPGTIDGTFGDNTLKALKAFAAKNGTTVSTYPHAEVLEMLGIAPQYWEGIVADAGAPEPQVGKTKLVAQRVMAADAADVQQIVAAAEAMPPSVPGTVTFPGAEPTTTNVTDVMAPPAAAAASGLTTKAWFSKNWPYLAAGGGVGVVLLAAALIATRKKSAAATAGLGQLSKMQNIRAGEQLCAAVVKGADSGKIRCGTVGPDMQLEYPANGGMTFAPIGEAWDMEAWAIPVTKKEADSLIAEGYARR